MFAIPIKVKAIEPYKIWVEFEDGKAGYVNLSNLKNKGIFNEWNKEGVFDKVYINPETYAIAWNEEIELCPNSVYHKIERKLAKN
ncbi:MAG: DUF2442 domain-containing protein [Ignavibacteria bacterium]|nr:DUF2442 domain-containing protein [Ignavibacteria bacterium]